MDLLTGVSLFSGIGGIDVALAPWVRTVCYVEYAPYCQRVLQVRIKDGLLDDAPILSDVRLVHSVEYLDNAVKTWYPPSNGAEYTKEEAIMAGKLRKLTMGQAEESVRLYDKGMSIGQVASYFGVSRQGMWDLLRRRTVLRPQMRIGESNHFYRNGKTADDHAQNMVEYAIRKGILQRRSDCELCGGVGVFIDGRSKIQAHHDDYNKPLTVRWLCQKCHHKWHRDNEAKRKEAYEELPDTHVDIVFGGFP